MPAGRQAAPAAPRAAQAAATAAPAAAMPGDVRDGWSPPPAVPTAAEHPGLEQMPAWQSRLVEKHLRHQMAARRAAGLANDPDLDIVERGVFENLAIRETLAAEKTEQALLDGQKEEERVKQARKSMDATLLAAQARGVTLDEQQLGMVAKAVELGEDPRKLLDTWYPSKTTPEKPTPEQEGENRVRRDVSEHAAREKAIAAGALPEPKAKNAPQTPEERAASFVRYKDELVRLGYKPEEASTEARKVTRARSRIEAEAFRKLDPDDPSVSDADIDQAEATGRAPIRWDRISAADVALLEQVREDLPEALVRVLDEHASRAGKPAAAAPAAAPGAAPAAAGGGETYEQALEEFRREFGDADLPDARAEWMKQKAEAAWEKWQKDNPNVPEGDPRETAAAQEIMRRYRLAAPEEK